jgi:hypothetical protein
MVHYLGVWGGVPMTDETAADDGGIREIWRRAWLVFNELFSHTGVMAAVILSIEAIQWLVSKGHGGASLLFFAGSPFAYPAKWLFDAADTAMIAAIMFRGVVSAYATYKVAKR